MLSENEAIKQLREMKVPNWSAQWVKRVADLPKEDAQAMHYLLDSHVNKNAMLDYQQKMEKKERQLKLTAVHLDSLTPDRRMACFATMLPKLAEHLERAWQGRKAAPYQLKHSFRSPASSEATAVARLAWIESLYEYLAEYDPDMLWLAAWAPHITQRYGSHLIGLLLAAGIDAGGDQGDQIMQTLIDSANGEHAIGVMGHHVIAALLASANPQGWAYIENLLLTAQREEGLRQSILSLVDMAHPQAFGRMLRLILEHDLERFASVTQAADGWFMLRWDSAAGNIVRMLIQYASDYLDNPDARNAAIAGDNPQKIYMALWASAYIDVNTAMPLAKGLLKHANPEIRFTGAWVLYLIDKPESHELVLDCLDDPDPRLVALALECVGELTHVAPGKAGVFRRLADVLELLPAKSRTLDPLLWPWLTLKLERSRASDLMPHFAGDDDWPVLEQSVSAMSPSGRDWAMERLKQIKELSPPMRRVLLKLTGDASGEVRHKAIDLLSKRSPASGEIQYLESLMTRRAGDLRRGVLVVLTEQSDEAALQSAARLVAAKSGPEQLAGLELAGMLHGKNRKTQDCEELVRSYKSIHDKLDPNQQNLIARVLGETSVTHSLEDALGLIDPANLTMPLPLEKSNVPLMTPAAMGYFASLDALIHTHRETVVTVNTWQGEEQVLLGNANTLTGWRFAPDDSESKKEFPLAQLWHTWWQDRPTSLRDEDGFDLLRAALLKNFTSSGIRYDEKYEPTGIRAWFDKDAGFPESLLQHNQPRIRYLRQIMDVIDFLAQECRPAGTADYLVNAAQAALALTPAADAVSWLRKTNYYTAWFHAAIVDQKKHPDQWLDPQLGQLIRLALWLDRPTDAKGQEIITPKSIVEQTVRDRIASKGKNEHHRTTYLSDEPRSLAQYVDLPLLGHAIRLGLMNDADAIATLLAIRSNKKERNDHLEQLTLRKTHPALKDHPPLADLVNRVRDRMLEVELARGEQPTVISHLIGNLASMPGINWLVRCLSVMGDLPFARDHSGYGQSCKNRKTSLSHLVHVSAPRPTDEPAHFAKAVKAAGIRPKRLVELAVFAPQWASHVEHALSWDGLEEGVWWLHAHTKDRQYYTTSETKEAWVREVAERTPLDSDDLTDGAVDVAWFTTAYARLGQKNWDALYRAAKNASSGSGHSRAQLFADAMTGNVTSASLIKRIADKRHQDTVRALGLLPLAYGKKRQADLLRRYELLQEFLRTSKHFGSQRQASEKRAAEIGQANLARTAGYPDPLRLEWAMEAQAIGDLAQGNVTAKAGEVVVTLNIDDEGEPVISVTKHGKPLKSIPASAKKDRHVKELQQRKTALKRQVSRMRKSLEQMMCTGQSFLGQELADLFAHPLLKPLLHRLVFIGQDIIGYPCQDGQTLVDHAGNSHSINPETTLKLAHPHDLHARGDWSKWQRDCFAAERIQPFKQLFRELYPITQAERDTNTSSGRYAGQQVNPRQAVALLNTRGWLVLPEEGIRKTFHDAKISAYIAFQEHFYTPAEVDGLTVESVIFIETGKWKHVELSKVPPLIFSEVMRDLDLVVSVAHRGGVDPQTSASTIQMRGDLLRETLAVLDINNIRIENQYVLIDGHHANYTVHLGSAVTHVLPGGSLIIVAIHSQHRGRMFLPFADDDPKTAEVMSKVLMLARDKQIKDPKILEQIRRLTP